MIIDAHAHILRSEYGNVEKYLEALAAAGVERGVVVPGGMVDVRRLTDYVTNRAAPSPDPPDNAYVQEAVETHAPRLISFYCVNPHAPGAVETLAAAFQRGSRGLKLSPLSHRFSFASRAVAELVDCCEAHGFPVYSHVLYTPGASTERFVSLARQFPRTPFILGHMGFGPADSDAIQAAAELDNVYLETSCGNVLVMEEAVRKAGATKVIFGSEFPLSHPKAELEKVLLLRLPDAWQERILCRNIQELTRLDDSVGEETR